MRPLGDPLREHAASGLTGLIFALALAAAVPLYAYGPGRWR